MMPKKTFIRRTLISAIIAAAIGGSLYALISFTVRKASVARQAQVRAERMREIEHELAAVEARLEELHRDLFEAETAPAAEQLTQSRPGPVGPQPGKEKVRPLVDISADFSGASVMQGLLLKEKDRLEQESLYAAASVRSRRRLIFSLLTGAAFGFGAVWLLVWFGRLRIINTRQRLVVAAGLAVIAAITVYPPWVIISEHPHRQDIVTKRDLGHSLIWRPLFTGPGADRKGVDASHISPDHRPFARGGSVDLARLSLQCLLVIAFAAGLFAAYADNGLQKDEQMDAVNRNHLALTES
ncbi:MAG: hypothetical protein ACYST6_03725 [Planctomycetota bacterium]|jgi:hypothetical protein